MSTIRLAIAGVGNCASSLVQGLQYYADANPDDEVPGLMHVVLGGYHISDIEVVAAFDVDATKVGQDVGKAIWAGQNNTIKFADVPDLGVRVQRAPTLDGFGKYYRQTCEESPAEPVDVTAGAARLGRRRARVVPAGGLRGGAEVLRPGVHRRRRRVRQRHPRVHRLRPGVGQEVHRRRRADRGRRHQEPGRRHHRAPHPGPPVRGPGHGARPHLPAQRRRQHGLQEHARARAPRVQEDLEDPVRHQPDRPRHRGRRRAHRPVRPRAVAPGPQVGLHPPRGPQLRRRAAEHRAQARGVGLAELGRRHHRRAALRQGRPGPRHRWPAARPVGVLHEEPAGAVPRRRGPARWSRTSPAATPDPRSSRPPVPNVLWEAPENGVFPQNICVFSGVAGGRARSRRGGRCGPRSPCSPRASRCARPRSAGDRCPAAAPARTAPSARAGTPRTRHP